jgi:hypothetical protein
MTLLNILAYCNKFFIFALLFDRVELDEPEWDEVENSRLIPKARVKLRL